jgi:NAD(P)-dependent dehydrogenase (short-subunit alcohol dehydrogenase family)
LTEKGFLDMQTILITGCSSGIGEASAKYFAQKGWNVAATMRKPAAANRLKDVSNIKLIALDVTDNASIGNAVAETLSAFGRIDALVNNAGYGLFGPFETASDEAIAQQFKTNVFGLFDVTRAVLPTMRAQRSGIIVNISSIGGLTTFPMNSLYHATKFALIGFSESLGFELAPFGIQVKIVAPGGVATDFAGRSLVTTFKDNNHPYADAVEKVAAAFRAPRSGRSTSEYLAENIYAAVTDGTPKTRYVVGEDAVALLAARAQMTDEQYIAFMGARMGLA